MKQGMVGDWIGTRTDPWDPPATVTVDFTASGTYSAHCEGDDPSCQVWHYGTDADAPEKTYDLYNLAADGTGIARIWIYFSDVDTTCQGTLSSITLNAASTSLSFDFEPTWIGTIGPVHFALTRQ